MLDWFILDANFVGNSKEDCTGDGACWVFIKVWFNRFMYGLYPDAEQWRINTAFLILFAVVTPLLSILIVLSVILTVLASSIYAFVSSQIFFNPSILVLSINGTKTSSSLV